MSPERITDLRQISDKTLVDLKTWLEPWFAAVRGGDSTGPRMIWGAVYNDAGIIDEGSGGWTATESGVAPYNLFTVTFDTSFTFPPIVLLTGNSNNAPELEGRYTVTLKTRALDHIVVRTDDVDDADYPSQDGGFDFLCVEGDGVGF